MKVGFFSPNYPGISGDGGIGTYTRALARSLVDSGHGVQVVTTGDRTTQILANQVPVSVVKQQYSRVLDRILPGAGITRRVGQEALRVSRTAELDLFEFPNWEGLGAWFALRRRLPLVVRLSTSSAETQQIDGLPNSWRLKCDVAREKLQARLADALITHSNAHRQLMAKELGVDANRISVIPLGVDVYREFVRAQQPARPPTVVFLGRLEKRKGALDLLNAIPHVLDQVSDARFVLIGPDRPHCPGGRSHREYARMEYPLHVQEHIEFAGSLSDEEVTQHLQTADLFVAPSLYESFGLIFLEAMRWGTPVVGTFAGGIPEIVEDGKSGVLVSPGNPTELAGAIVSLLKDPQRRRGLGEAGRERVESHFSVATAAARTLEIYTDVLSRQSPRH